MNSVTLTEKQIQKMFFQYGTDKEILDAILLMLYNCEGEVTHRPYFWRKKRNELEKSGQLDDYIRKHFKEE